MARPNQLTAALARIDAEMAKLQTIRDYLTTTDAPEPTAETPRKRGRKAKAAKEPATDAGKF